MTGELELTFFVGIDQTGPHIALPLSAMNAEQVVFALTYQSEMSRKMDAACEWARAGGSSCLSDEENELAGAALRALADLDQRTADLMVMMMVEMPGWHHNPAIPWAEAVRRYWPRQ